MEDFLKRFLEENIETIFKDFEIAGKEQILTYKGKKLGRIDLLLKHKVENKFIIVEIKYKGTNEEAITQINKYFTYFVKKYKLDPKNVRRVLIDIDIPKEVQDICKFSNIECKIISEKFFKKWKETSQLGISVDESIIRVLKQSENPVSSREISLKIERAWHTVNTHCLQLQIDGKVERLKISNLNLWRIKK